MLFEPPQWMSCVPVPVAGDDARKVRANRLHRLGHRVSDPLNLE